MKFLKILHTLFLFLLIILIYAASLKAKPGNIIPSVKEQKMYREKSEPPFETSLERGRYAEVISLAKYQTFNVDKFVEFVKPDVAWYNNHYYPAFPPGVSVLALPAFLLGFHFELSQLFTFATSALFSFLTCLVVFELGKKFNLSRPALFFAVLTFAFASSAFVYGVTLSAHPISAFLISLALLTAIKTQNNKHVFLKMAFLWFLFGVNIFIDYPNLAVMLPVLAYAIFPKFSVFHLYNPFKDLHKLGLSFPLSSIIASIVLVPIFAAFVSYNLVHYKKPFAFTNTYNLQLIERYGLKTTHLTNDIFKKLPYSSRFKLTNLPSGVFTLFFSKDRGLFVFSPVFLLSILGIFALFRKQSGLLTPILAVLILNILVYGAFDDPWGGWAFGPRYLIISIPFLSILAGVGFDLIRKTKPFLNLMSIVLFGVSVAISTLGALTTTSVPPEIEAIPLKVKSNFLYNLDYIQSGKISSFAYNFYFHKFLLPLDFSAVLVGVIIVFCAASCLLLVPRQNSNKITLETHKIIV